MKSSHNWLWWIAQPHLRYPAWHYRVHQFMASSWCKSEHLHDTRTYFSRREQWSPFKRCASTVAHKSVWREVNSGWQVTAISSIKHNVWIENKIWEDVLSVCVMQHEAILGGVLIFNSQQCCERQTTSAPQCPLFLGSVWKYDIDRNSVYSSHIVNPLCLE